MERALHRPYVRGGGFWPRSDDDLGRVFGRLCRAYPAYRLADLVAAPAWEIDALLRALPALEAEENLRWGNVVSLPHLTAESVDRVRGAWRSVAGWASPVPIGLVSLPGARPDVETVIGDTWEKIAAWFGDLGDGVTVA